MANATNTPHRRGNRVMLSKGYAPAADVARTLDKTLSTIHRMVEDGRIDGARDGRALYVKLDSLIDFYTHGDLPNEEMATLVRALAKEITAELEAADKGEQP